MSFVGTSYRQNICIYEELTIFIDLKSSWKFKKVFKNIHAIKIRKTYVIHLFVQFGWREFKPCRIIHFYCMDIFLLKTKERRNLSFFDSEDVTLNRIGLFTCIARYFWSNQAKSVHGRDPLEPMPRYHLRSFWDSET